MCGNKVFAVHDNFVAAMDESKSLNPEVLSNLFLTSLFVTAKLTGLFRLVNECPINIQNISTECTLSSL